MQGLLPFKKALKRSGAQVGDKVYVSANLGDAAGALDAVLKGDKPDTVSDQHLSYLLSRFYTPTPRLALGQWLLENGATAALDISDGLLGDLKHILVASDVGAQVNPDAVPYSESLKSIVGEQRARQYALTGGDDYELCFTWPADIDLILPEAMACQVTCIGSIVKGSGIMDMNTGQVITAEAYRHF